MRQRIEITTIFQQDLRKTCRRARSVGVAVYALGDVVVHALVEKTKARFEAVS